MAKYYLCDLITYEHISLTKTCELEKMDTARHRYKIFIIYLFVRDMLHYRFIMK